MLFGRRQRTIKRILIVEDEPLVAFDNEHVLLDAGYTVVATVDNGEEASRRIAAGGIDLVMADVRLRGSMSGIDVARIAHAAGVPVLFATGACPPEARRVAVGCLAKPFMARDLLAAIALVSARLTGAPPPRRPRAFTLFEE